MLVLLCQDEAGKRELEEMLRASGAQAEATRGAWRGFQKGLLWAIPLGFVLGLLLRLVLKFL